MLIQENRKVITRIASENGLVVFTFLSYTFLLSTLGFSYFQPFSAHHNHLDKLHVFLLKRAARTLFFYHKLEFIVIVELKSCKSINEQKKNSQFLVEKKLKNPVMSL